MTAEAQSQKLHLFQMIASLDDEQQIRRAEKAMAKIVENPYLPPPSDAELVKIASRGQAQIEAGEYVTEDELFEAFDKGVEEGLRVREANIHVS